MLHQRCYGGVRLLGEGPSPRNVARLDDGCLPMTHTMMQRGIQIDPSHFEAMALLLKQDMEAVTEDISAIAGHYVNPGSGDQVAHFLFKELGLKQARTKLTPSQSRESVENEVLTAIQHTHPVVSKLLNYKEYEKLHGTYATKIPKLAKRVGLGQWRLLPNLKRTRVPSGRFAAEEPNLLAMPNRTKRGRELLKGFITDTGWTLLSVDFSQIEPRVLAHRSQDPRLIEVYQNREDLYSDFAIGAFKLPDQRYQDAEGWHYPGVDKKAHRFPSKTCSLAAIYRVTNKGLVEQMPVLCRNCGVSAAEHREDCLGFQAQWNEDNCQEIIHAFYQRYARISSMQKMDDVRAKRFGYVWDDWGRMLHMPAVNSVLPWVASAALREGGNLPIQGFAFGCLALAMAQIQDEMTDVGMLGEVYWPILPIHDEILGEVREDLAEEVGEYIKDVFSKVVQLRVPISAEWASAPTWGDIVK